mmetsp:Transcript_6590/g.16713  ORF Transcript_6590/g.16713 Transcript_6590/m.16713 type:complete len:222 (+) Transcript_6590:27-692(+)
MSKLSLVNQNYRNSKLVAKMRLKRFVFNKEKKSHILAAGTPHQGGISACLLVPDGRERCVGHLRTMIPFEVVVNVRQAVGGRRHGCAHLVVGVIRLFVRAVDARDGLGKTEVPRVVAHAAALHAIDAVHLAWHFVVQVPNVFLEWGNQLFVLVEPVYGGVDRPEASLRRRGRLKVVTGVGRSAAKRRMGDLHDGLVVELLHLGGVEPHHARHLVPERADKR